MAVYLLVYAVIIFGTWLLAVGGYYIWDRLIRRGICRLLGLKWKARDL